MTERSIPEVIAVEPLPIGARGSRRAVVRWSDGSDVRRHSVHLAPELPVSLKAIFEAAQTAALPACLTTTTIYSSHERLGANRAALKILRRARHTLRARRRRAHPA